MALGSRGHDDLDSMMGHNHRRYRRYSETERTIRRFRRRAAVYGAIAIAACSLFSYKVITGIEEAKDKAIPEIQAAAGASLDKALETNIGDYKRRLDESLDGHIDEKVDRIMKDKEEDIREYASRIAEESSAKAIEKNRQEYENRPEVNRKAYSTFLNPKYKYLIHYNKDSNILSLYSFETDNLIMQASGSDAIIDGQKNSYADNKTPEGLYLVESMQGYSDENAKSDDKGIKLGYPNNFEMNNGFTGEDIFIKAAPNEYIEHAVRNRDDISKGDIIIMKDDMLTLQKIISYEMENTLIGIENSKDRFDPIRFLEMQYETYRTD